MKDFWFSQLHTVLYLLWENAIGEGRVFLALQMYLVREGITFYEILEAHTPCAMVMYVMTPPVDICVRDHTPRASMYTCLYLFAVIPVRDFRCQYVIYPYFYVI